VLFALQESGLDWDLAPRAAAIETVTGTLTVQTSNLNAPVRSEVSRTVINTVMQTCEPILITESPQSDDFLSSTSVTQLGLQSILCVPVPHPTRRNRAIAVIYYDSREPGTFGVEDLAFLEDVVDLCAPAFLALDAPYPALPPELIRHSKPFSRVVRALRRQHNAGRSVLIGGESGTGKSLLANWLREHGPRSQIRSVRIDCSRGEEVSVRLFGRVQAGMGTTTRRRSAIDVAHRGALILEQVDALTPDLQARLLARLESEENDVVIIATESRSIPRMIEDGRFSRGLFAALGGRLYVVPPLRNRPEDLEAIARSMIERAGFELDPALLEALAARSWPGNVRQLVETLEQMLWKVVARDQLELKADALPASAAEIETQGQTTEPVTGGVEEVALRQLRATLDDLPILPFRQVASVVYAAALQRHDGNVSAAARALRLNRNTFYSRIEKAGLEIDRTRDNTNHRGDEVAVEAEEE